jgi:hypothetical protein
MYLYYMLYFAIIVDNNADTFDIMCDPPCNAGAVDTPPVAGVQAV